MKIELTPEEMSAAARFGMTPEEYFKGSLPSRAEVMEAYRNSKGATREKIAAHFDITVEQLKYVEQGHGH